MPGLTEHAFGLKTLTDAVRLRNHVLRQPSLADAAADRHERRAWATFVVVGAGYTGTEAAAQLRRLALAASPTPPADVRFLLVERAGQVLLELGRR